MRTKLVSIVKILSVIIMCIGTIHEVATYTPLIQDGLECLSEDNHKAMMYMSLMCGASLILSGGLLLLLLKKIEIYSFLACPILVISVFVLMNGILSIIFMFENPFAWMVFALGLTITVVSLKLRKVSI